MATPLMSSAARETLRRSNEQNIVKDGVTDIDAQRATPQAVTRKVRFVPGEVRVSMHKDAFEPKLAPAGIPLFRRSPRLAHELSSAEAIALAEASSSPVKSTPVKPKAGKLAPPAAPRRRKSAQLDEPAGEITDEEHADAAEVRPIRPLKSAPELEIHLKAAGGLKSSARPLSRKEGGKMAAAPPELEQDLPIEGPPFSGMPVSSNEDLPMLNAQSTEHFQKCYESDDLPHEQLESMHSQLGMEGQMKVRLAAADAYQQPLLNAPPHSRTELQQHLNSGAPKDDVRQIAADGTVSITNDSFRICATDDCSFLSYCQLSQKNGSKVLLSHSSCSRYCQIALCNKVATTARRAGAGGRFMYPAVSTVPRMSNNAWKTWKTRWNAEARSRQAITEAFKVYRELYGAENANQVVALAKAHPMTSNELPRYPSFAMRTKTGPLIENRGDEGMSQVVRPEPVPPEVTDDQHVLPVSGNEPYGNAAEDLHTGPMAGEGHARRNRISAAGSLPFSKPSWPSKLQRSNSVTADTSISSMNARQDMGEAPYNFKESLSAFHAPANPEGEMNDTVILNGKEYSSSKSEKSRKRNSDGSRLVAIETENIAEGTRPRQTAELASLFPEVHSEIAWQATQGLLELESSAEENKANETHHFSDRDVDFTEFGLGRYEATHESILYYQANVQQTFIQITENDYKLCPDFGSIFKKMSEPKPFTLDCRLQKNLQAQMDQQAGLRANKQKLQKGKLIVTDMQAEQAIKTGKYTLRDALLYHTNHTGEELVCVPDDSLKHGMPALRNKLMTEVHKGLTAMHLGSNRSEYEIRRHAYWPRIRNDIHAFLAACTKCQQNKINRRAPQGLLQSLAIPRRPGTHYALDFVTHLPYSSREEYDALLVIVDRFSKRVWLIPTWGTATAEVTAMLFLKHIIYENGIALEIVSDRDSKFTSKFWTAFHAHLGTALKLSSARHQSTDGTTERMIAFVEEAMRMSITYRQNNWVKLLPKIQFSINSTPSKATGLSPFYVEKGRHAVTNLDRDNILRRGDSTDPDIDEFVAGIHNIEQQVRERMELTRHWMERDADKRRRNISASLHPGAYAYLSTKGITMPVDKERTSTKLRQLYYGPYKILRQLSPVSFQLQLPAASRIHDVFHCSLLKPASDLQTNGIRGAQLPTATDSGEYEVEKILTRRGEAHQRQYLIKWKNFPMEDCSWEVESNLKNSKRILAAFNNKYEIEQQRRLL